MTENPTAYNFPIDIVYLWVDGNDPEWRTKRNRYLNIGGDFAGQGRVEARWVDNQELRYSLRSLEKYAPWIRRIFIVTDNQCPAWLNRHHPKIQIVDHTEILPSEALPTYNSRAIESCIHRIKDLSEHFLLGNDDTMLGAPVTPATFFTPDGRPIIRLNGNRYNRRKALRRGDNYSTTLCRMQDMVTKICGCKIYHAPHHNIDAYRRSDIQRSIEVIPQAWAQTTLHRFRHTDDIDRSFVNYYTLALKQGVLQKVGRYNGATTLWARMSCLLHGSYRSDSRCIPVQCPDYSAVFRKYNPLMFCMNDGEGATDDDRHRMVDFLQHLLPDPSPFEL